MDFWRYPIFSIEFLSTFLNAESDPHVLVSTPEGAETTNGHCCKLKRALYEFPRAPRFWYKTLEKFLQSLELTCSVTDACLYYQISKALRNLILIPLDNLILCIEPDNEKRFMKSGKYNFEVHDLGFPAKALETKIHSNKSKNYHQDV